MKLVLVLLAVLPSSLAQSPVHVFPLGPVTTSGRNITFSCLLVTATPDRFQSIQWLLNGSELESLGLDDAITQFNSIGNGVGTLVFIHVPSEYNQTLVQCRGSLESSRVLTSEGVVLLLQGSLSAVASLQIRAINSTISLNWVSPFTLDLFSTITYCVCVVNSTSSARLEISCGSDETRFEYPLPSGRSCDDYMFTVTPVNEAGNGTPTSIQYSQALTPPRVIEVRPPTLSSGMDRASEVIVYYIVMSAPVCNAEITITAEQTTGEHAMAVFLGPEDLSIMRTIIAFTSEKLTLNRRYSFTVDASNVNGSATSSSGLSTYGVAGAEILRNPLSIRTTYLPNSRTTGVLYSFLFLAANGVIDFTKSTYLSLSRNNSLSYLLPSGLPEGIYYVYSYAIEEDGLLLSGEALPATADSGDFSESGNLQDSIPPPSSFEIEQCSIQSMDLSVSVQCSPPSSSPPSSSPPPSSTPSSSSPPPSSSLGFLVILQRNSIGEARRLLVNRSQLDEPQGPVTVQVPENGVYQVTVFAISDERGILDSNLAYTAQISVDEKVVLHIVTTPQPRTVNGLTPVIIGVIAGFGVLALLTVILGGIVIAVQYFRRSSNRAESTSDRKGGADLDNPAPKEEQFVLAPRASLVYEEIGDVKDSFSYTRNVLYGGLPPGLTSGLSSDLTSDLPQHSAEETQTPEYELIKEAEHQRLSDVYKVQQCSAYGIPPAPPAPVPPPLPPAISPPAPPSLSPAVDRSCDPCPVEPEVSSMPPPPCSGRVTQSFQECVPLM